MAKLDDLHIGQVIWKIVKRRMNILKKMTTEELEEYHVIRVDTEARTMVLLFGRTQITYPEWRLRDFKLNKPEIKSRNILGQVFYE